MKLTPEIHLFIVWHNALEYRAQIIENIEKDLTILGIHDINWDLDKFEENITRFYRKRPNMSDKANRVGRDYFTLIVVKDENPTYENRHTSKGDEVVNINIFDRKEHFRSITGPPNDLIHATNNIQETNHDLTLLTGTNCKDYLNNCKESNIRSEDFGNLVAAHGWKSVSQLFYVLNNTLEYVVLRNWESLPDHLLHDTHKDVDMLVNNLTDASYILNAKKVFPEPLRVHYHVTIQNEIVPFDIRYVGDNYYDINFEKDIMNTRVLHPNKFYTPNVHNHFYSLLYHAYIHKNGVKDKYKIRLSQLTDELTPNYFNDENNIATLLQTFLKINNYKLVQPEPSVVYNLNAVNLINGQNK